MDDNAIDVLLNARDVRNLQTYPFFGDGSGECFEEEIVMEHTRKALGVRVPSSWNDVAIGALKTLLIAFVAMLAWDWFESGDFDPAGVGTNALAVAAALFVLDALLMRAER